MFELYKKSQSLLGMNARNLEYVRRYNLRRGRKIADQKLLCKKILTKNNLPVSKLLAKITSHAELEDFDWASLPESFALKPNRGFGGEGIVVVYGRKKGRTDAWVKADGSLITVSDLQSHIENILDGAFSLSNTPDIAFFEERLKLLKLFKPYSWKGIPDIRVIVFNNVPVMAMLRLPTQESGGKANLQHGALGLGIDMSNGTTTTAIQGIGQFGKLIEYAPGTRLFLSGIKIPYWRDILKMAIEAQKITGLGFLGADIAIDRDLGPVILELNARPGLSIQLANMDGLKGRLERVTGLKIKNTDHGVRVGVNLFGGEIEESIEELSGKRVIGSVEKIKLLGKNGKEVEVEAKIDTGAFSSSIDKALAKELGYEKTLEEFEKIDFSAYTLVPENEAALKKEVLEKYQSMVPDLEDVAIVFSASGSSIRPVIKISFILDHTEVVASCNIGERAHLKYPMIVGKRNLGRYLIDVNKA